MRLLRLIDLRTAMLFAFLGPPVGLLAFMASAVAVDPSQWHDRTWVLIFVSVGLPVSYAFGFLPALTTGLVFGMFQRPLSSARRPQYACGLGLLCGGMISAVFDLGVRHYPELYAPASMACTGAAAGLVCGYITYRRWLRRSSPRQAVADKPKNII